MSHFLKTILYLIIAFFILLFYLIFTESGLQKTYSVLSYMASEKSGLRMRVINVQLSKLNFIDIKMELEDKYSLRLNGFLGFSYFDINYILTGKSIASDICSINDNLNINGKIYGKYKKFNINGKGTLLDGNINYSLLSDKNIYRNILIDINEITSSKLFRLLGEESFFRGKSNSKIYFEYIKENEKKGYISYSVKNSNFSGFISDLKLDVQILNDTHQFSFEVLSPNLKLRIKKGKYNQTTKYANALYHLDIKDLSSLKDVLGSAYYGNFSLKGEIDYKTKLRIDGISSSLGGDLAFNYYDNHIEMQQEGISVEKMFSYVNSKSPIRAFIWGHTYYDMQTEYFEMTNRIKDIHFIPSSISQAVKKKFDFDLTKEHFEDSSFDVILSKGILSSDIKIGNENIFIALRDTKFDTKKLFVKTSLKFSVPKHQIEGKIYARMDQNAKKDEVADTYIKFNGKIDKYYSLIFDGILNDRWLNIDYKIDSQRFPSHICTIEDNVSIKGHINGVYSHLHFQVDGKLLEGELSFDATKVDKRLENVSFNFNNIHALKLFTLLGYPSLPYGKIDVNAHFNSIGTDAKDGVINSTLKNSFIYDLPLTFKSRIKVNNDMLFFNATATLPHTLLKLQNGEVNLLNNHIHSDYIIENNKLSALEKIVNYSFNGKFKTKGELDYNKTLFAKGDSKSFGGIINYTYTNNLLLMNLNNVSLAKFTNLFPNASYFDADIMGNIKFDINKTDLKFNSQLNNAKFLPSEPVQIFKDKAGVDLLKERFDNSSLEATYKNNILEADVVLKNRRSHLYISNIKVDNNSTKINAFFDFKMQGQEFLGKIYGTTSKPKVNLDVQRLLRYQMDKQLDAIIGQKNNRLMEKIPMTGMAKDVSTGMAASFVGMFF